MKKNKHFKFSEYMSIILDSIDKKVKEVDFEMWLSLNDEGVILSTKEEACGKVSFTVKRK